VRQQNVYANIAPKAESSLLKGVVFTVKQLTNALASLCSHMISYFKR